MTKGYVELTFVKQIKVMNYMCDDELSNGQLVHLSSVKSV